MTLANTTVKDTYIANGTNRNWEYTFPFRSTDDLHISTVDEEGTETEINTAYEIDAGNSRVIYPTQDSSLAPLAEGIKVVLWRDTPVTQNIDLQRQGVLDAQELEGGLDKLTMIAQELDERLGRALIYPPGTQDPLNAAEYLSSVQKSEQNAVASAAQADKNAEDALNAQRSAEIACEGAQVAQNAAEGAANSAAQDSAAAADFWEKVQARQRKEFIYTVGVPLGTYSGSLTEIDTGNPLAGLDVEVYLNGVNKEQGTEYSISGTKIIFSFELTAGSKVKIRLGDLVRTAKEADVEAAILAHNTDAQAHPGLEERVSKLEGNSENYIELYNYLYTGQQLTDGFGPGKTIPFALGNLVGKTITRIEAWAGNGTEGNPYFPLPWSYGWHVSGEHLTLYYVRPGVYLDWAEYYTEPDFIKVVTRVYYK